MKTTARNPLVNAQCRKDKQHMVIYGGVGLCCVHDYSKDPVKQPRSYTLPTDRVVA
jgi:hypothetical protein